MRKVEKEINTGIDLHVKTNTWLWSRGGERGRENIAYANTLAFGMIVCVCVAHEHGLLPLGDTSLSVHHIQVIIIIVSPGLSLFNWIDFLSFSLSLSLWINQSSRLFASPLQFDGVRQLVYSLAPDEFDTVLWESSPVGREVYLHVKHEQAIGMTAWAGKTETETTTVSRWQHNRCLFHYCLRGLGGGQKKMTLRQGLKRGRGREGDSSKHSLSWCTRLDWHH